MAITHASLPAGRPRRRLARYLAAVAAIPTPFATAQPFINLGPAELALDQPRVAVEVFDPTTTPPNSFGPDLFNTFLLDTGATAILAGGNPFIPEFSATGELVANGMANEGTFEERGVAGSTIFDVSAPYGFDFAGSDGARHTLSNTRILSNDAITLGFDGIVGTPAMINRVTTFDMSVWSGGDLFDVPLMGVAFSDSDPPDDDHRYSIPVELVNFDATADGPTPTSGPLPFITIGVSNAGLTPQGQFVFDTGAQLSILTTHLGLAAGLDTSGDGVLDENDERFVDFITFGGVGGETDAPLFDIDQIRIPTEQGVDLVYNGAQVAILDIDPAIDGIVGSDLLTSGWLSTILLGGPDGYIRKAHLDLRNPDALTSTPATAMAPSTGTLFLDLNPDLDVVVPEPAVITIFLPCFCLAFRRHRASRSTRSHTLHGQ